MYVTATSPRFSLGKSTPATLAISRLRLFERRLCRRNLDLGGGIGRGAKPPSEQSSLACLVSRILADDPRHALTLDDFAVFTAHLDRRSYLHRFLFPTLPTSYLNR